MAQWETPQIRSARLAASMLRAVCGCACSGGAGAGAGQGA